MNHREPSVNQILADQVHNAQSHQMVRVCAAVQTAWAVIQPVSRVVMVTNVASTMIVDMIKLVLVIAARIHAQAPVDRVHYVKLKNIIQFASALPD